jgi:opacity protein-like surface antigen
VPLYKTIFCFILATSASYASTKFYIGLDASLQQLDVTTDTLYIVNSPKTKSMDSYYRTKSINPAVFLGLDIANILKIETSYSAGSHRKKNHDPAYYYYSVGDVLLTDSNIRHETISLDFKPYMHLKSIDEKLFGFIILGASYNKIKIDEKEDNNLLNIIFYTSKKSASIYKISPAIGIGAEYLVSPHLALRTQVKYTYFQQEAGNSKLDLKRINNITNLNFGAAYYF